MLSINTVSSTRTALALLAGRTETRDVFASKTATGVNPTPVGNVTPLVGDALLQIADLTARLGADSASARPQSQLEGAAFEDKVMSWLSRIYADDEGFQQAVANGTLKVQRAVDVEALGFRSYIVDVQKNGNHLGSAGAVTVNKQYLSDLRASGGNHIVGTAEGQDYYVTW